MLFETGSYFDLPVSLLVDITVLLVCTVLLLRYGRLTHSHPGISYLFFHIIAITSRVLAIMAGGETLFSQWGGIFEPVTDSEIVRAVLLADVTLVVMTGAWIRVSIVSARQKSSSPSGQNAQPVTLSLQHIWSVVAIAFPIGVIGLALLGGVPGLEKPEIHLGEWQESSWVLVTMSWAGLALVALIYWYGFRWWLVAPIIIHLVIIGLQGHHRFRALIPLVLLLQIYLDRHRKKWPPVIFIVIIVAGMLFFYPMKDIGRLTQEGASISEISELSSETLHDVISGQNGDQTILDQLASSLTLVDRADKLYYGTTYLVLFTSPIPRQWWPNKPILNFYQEDISTPSRPMKETGMIMTFIGEFYINFGYLGIVIMAYVTAYFLGQAYFKAYRSNYFSIKRFIYLMVACNLILVFRDGLVSLFVFTVVNMMPLAVIAFLHYLRPVEKSGGGFSRIVPGDSHSQMRQVNRSRS